MLGASEAQSADTPPPSDVPASVERIRDRLQRPPTFQLPPEANFRVTVEEDLRLRQTALDMLRQELGADVKGALPWPLSTAGQQIVGVDLLRLAMSVKSAVNAARRARGERNARSEVSAALAGFCATHDCSVLEQELTGSNPEGILTH
jgi:hypothetical protein